MPALACILHQLATLTVHIVVWKVTTIKSFLKPSNISTKWISAIRNGRRSSDPVTLHISSPVTFWTCYLSYSCTEKQPSLVNLMFVDPCIIVQFI